MNKTIITSATILLTVFLLPGCPLSEQENHRLMTSIDVESIKTNDSKDRMTAACGVDVISGVIKQLGAQMGFEDGYHYNILSNLKDKGEFSASSVFIILNQKAKKDELIFWEHAFILTPTSYGVKVQILRPCWNKKEMGNYPGTYYSFDWVSAIRDECAKRGIATSVIR